MQSRFNQLNKDKYFTSNTSINHSISTSIAYKLKQFQIAIGWKWRENHIQNRLLLIIKWNLKV